MTLFRQGLIARAAAGASAAAVIWGLLVVPAAGTPQTRRPAAPGARQQPAQGGEEFQLGTDLVVLDVTVVDRANRPVFDLPKERFQVLEDNVPQEITFFSREEAPVSIGLVIDSSGSMRTKLDTVVQAVTNLVRTNKPQDEAAVIGFKDEVELLEEFTTNEADVEDALGDLIAAGQTALLDALRLSADYVQKEGRNRRKALVIITDGVEKGSYYTYDQVAEHLKATLRAASSRSPKRPAPSSCSTSSPRTPAAGPSSRAT
jgi:Ca-activated chloride channel family protein